MKAPNLNRKLVLEGPQQVPDDAGGYVTVWQALGTHWAQILNGLGRERLENGLPRSTVPLRVIVRASRIGSTARPVAGQRFRDETRIFQITAVTERDPEGRYLMCIAEEEVAA
jgi:head-tail adaptor